MRNRDLYVLLKPVGIDGFGVADSMGSDSSLVKMHSYFVIHENSCYSITYWQLISQIIVC